MPTQTTAPGTDPDLAGKLDLPHLLREAVAPRQLWLWPIAVVVAVAVAGQEGGPFGAAVVVAEILAVGLLALTSWLGAGRTAMLALVSTVAGTGLAVLLYWQLNLGAPEAARPSGLLDLRGREAPATLDGLNFRGALLAGVKLDGDDLRGRDFSGAQAAGASFVNADLTKAALRGADLRGADFTGACMRAVDLAGARLAGATVDGAFAPDATPRPSASDGVLGKFATVKPKSCR